MARQESSVWLADSVPAPDCTDFTPGDQCNVVSTAGYTGSASILTRTLDGVNGSVSLIGSLFKLFSDWVGSRRYPERYEPRW